MSIDGVEADNDPPRLTELERQREKTKWMAEEREDREKLKVKYCDCIGGCLESDGFLQNNKQKLPNGVKCQIKNNS